MDKGQKVTVIILAACLAILLIVLLTVFLTRDDASGEFTPPPFEANAKTEFDEQPPQESQYVPLAVTEEFTVALCANAYVKDGKAEIFYTSLKTNTAWTRIKLFDEEGNLLGECGILKPGEHVQAISLSSIPKQDTKIKIKIYIYEPETYYSEGSREVKINLSIKDS